MATFKVDWKFGINLVLETVKIKIFQIKYVKTFPFFSLLKQQMQSNVPELNFLKESDALKLM